MVRWHRGRDSKDKETAHQHALWPIQRFLRPKDVDEGIATQQAVGLIQRNPQNTLQDADEKIAHQRASSPFNGQPQQGTSRQLTFL